MEKRFNFAESWKRMIAMQQQINSVAMLVKHRNINTEWKTKDTINLSGLNSVEIS